VKRTGHFFLILLMSLFSSCSRKERKLNLNDFEKVKNRGKLIAVTLNNSTDYFIYKGEPMGYQLELLQSLADYLNTELEVVVKNDIDESLNALDKGECDLVAMNLIINKPRSEQFSFTIPIGQCKQVLVQRKPLDYKEISTDEMESSLIRNQIDLGNKVIYVVKGSASSHRLKNLAEEIGKEITVIEVPDYEEEQLIKMVSDGTIDYTVANDDVAKVALKYYENNTKKLGHSVQRRRSSTFAHI